MTWESETAMCAFFAASVAKNGWVVHPETAGHDMVLVANQDNAEFCAGETVAVEAKLRANVTLLRQAAPPLVLGKTMKHYAHMYVALVPACTEDFRIIATALMIDVVVCDNTRGWQQGFRLHSDYRDPLAPGLPVPPSPVDTPAGVPSPRVVTRWKLAAVRICLEAMSHPAHEIERTRFARLNVEPRLWIVRGWAVRVSKTTYRILDSPTRPDRLYPEIVAVVAAER